MAWNLGAIKTFFRVDTSNWTRGHKQVKTDIRALGMEVAKLGTLLTGFATITVREFGTFDRAIREALAVSDVTTEQFAEMSKMAEDMSVALNKAATETTKGFYYLGSAGLSATEQLQSFASVVKMARAMTVDVGVAAEGVVNIMKGFNITFDESENVANQLVKTVITSNQVFSELNKAMSYIAGTAEFTNNKLSEMNALLGIMAGAGIKGSYAGTTMRRALTNLISPTRELSNVLRRLNVDVYDSEGVMKPYVTLIGELSDALSDYGDQYKGVAYKALFGVRAITGQIKIFEATSKRVREYAAEIENANTALEDVTKKQMAAFLHQLGRVWRWTQRVARSIGEALVPNLRGFIDFAIPFIKSLDEWIDANKELVTTIVKITAAAGALMLVLGPTMYILPNMVRSTLLLASAFATLGVPILVAIAGFYALRAAWGITWDDMVDVVNDFSAKFSTWLGNFTKMWEDAFRIDMLEAVRALFNRVIDGWMKIIFLLREFLLMSEDVSENMREIAEAPVLDYFGATTDKVKALGAEMQKLARDDITQLKLKLMDAYPELARFIAKMQELLLGPGVTPTLPGAPPSGPDAKDVEGRGAATWTKMWTSAAKDVINGFGEMSDKVKSSMEDIVNGWEQSTNEFLQLTGTFGEKLKQLMDNIFNSVYQSFVNAVSKIAAQKMFRAFFGEGIISYKDPTTATAGGGGVTAGGVPTRQSAGKIAVSITNNGEPLRVGSAQASFIGRDTVLNIVTEAVETDTTFRRNLRGE